ncbi:MAG: carboxy terminal-processing peptidase [SAR324 cluster bacterium]|nr:carboxy terminal-processing peptidase [SAR324 cluster bacterium]
MHRYFKIAAIAALLVFTTLQGSASARSDTNLNGEDVAGIVKMFLRSHFSRAKFDDTHSSQMLVNFINRFDSGHYYFLQRDIDEFQAYSRRLDDLTMDGDIKPAFTIFERFRKRVNERAEVIAGLLEGKFDLKSQDSLIRDRKQEPFPKDDADVKRLWAKKLKFEMLEQVLADTKDSEARKNLNQRYRSFRIQINRYKPNDVVTAYLNAFTSAYDPHSSYLSPDDLENFNISLRLSLEGIGATLRWEDGVTVVTSIIPGGAAWREGSLKKEDKIVGVAQGQDGEFQDMRNLRLIDVVKRIRGKRGTTVRLAVLRKSEKALETRHEIAIVRDKIILKEGEAKGTIMERPGKGGAPLKLGVIKLPSFYVDFSKRHSNPKDFKSSSRDVANILKDFKAKKVQGVVLDLRDNGGGGLDEAVQLSGLFLRKGPVVMVKNIRGRISVLYNPHSRPVYEGPLLVMTNRYSASASEILAGALKDYGRALLVGERATFGKGTVQNIIQISNRLGALKTTVAKFYRPGSSSTQNKGVVPDVVLSSLNNHLDMGESSLQNAMSWDSIRRATFQPWADLSPFLPVIQERSRQRQRNHPEFVKIRERVAEYLENENYRKVVTVSRMIESRKKNGKPIRPKPRNRLVPRDDKEEREDFVLDESLQIMVDYIQLQRKQPLNQVVIRKQ